MEKHEFRSRQLSWPTFRRGLDILIEVAYLAAIFLVPLSFAWFFPTYNIFELNKAVVFRLIFWLLLSLSVLKLAFFRLEIDYRRFWKKYLLIPGFFLAALALSLTFSLDPVRSFFGSYDRQQGWSSYFFYIFWYGLVLFQVLTLGTGKRGLAERLQRVAGTVVASGAIVSLYGVLQILGIDIFRFNKEIAPFLTYRALSSFGQPNFLGSFLLLVIPLSVYLLVFTRRFWLRFVYFLALALNFACLFFTSSRGAFLAFSLVFLGFVIGLLFSRASRKLKLAVAVGGLSLIFLALAAFLAISPERWQKTFSPGYGSVAIRQIFYRAAASASLSNPVFGYGLETGTEIFIKYYAPDWAIFGDVGMNADRAHNLFLDIIISSGFWGLAWFSVIYYYFFLLAYENWRRRVFPWLSLALAAGAAAYLISLLFSFPVTGTEVYFWLFMSLLAAANAPADISRASWEKRSLRPAVLGLAAAMIVLAASQASRSLGLLKADYYFNKIMNLHLEDEFGTALVLSEPMESLALNAANRLFYLQSLGEILSGFYPRAQDLSAQRLIEAKLKQIAGDLYGRRDYKSLFISGQIASALGQTEAANGYFSALEDMAPDWTPGLVSKARFLARWAGPEEASQAYLRAFISLPDPYGPNINEEHRNSVLRFRYLIFWDLGEVYFKAGEYGRAGAYFQAAYRAHPADYSLLKRIADSYYMRGDLDKALFYAKHGLARNPSDYRWALAVAGLYQAKGDALAAGEYFDLATSLAPDSEAIKEIEASYK